ncbi:uncharacterized protein LOC122820575 [Gambusia affinis]|uniref:uncharacterized protein LOC122820575 n=1 Tax=Gambusia affinis TaxID=33528 RepID=UPI001CDB55E7|nr:uncharacterized protein LOC122820575 [Gambusia affinis]
MEWISLFVPAVFLLPFIRGDLVASLGDTVKLSSQVNCAQLIRRLKDLSSAPMADSANGVLQPVDEYRSRLNISSSGIFLKNVNYNDNGHYELMCGDNEVLIKLAVVFASNISASEGETTKLPCFSLTLDEHLKFVLWETNGQLVIKVDRSGNVEYGERFTGRASLPPDWESAGDLSLILKGVQLDDQGNYYCYVQKDSKEKGDPAACRLRVQQERSSIKTSATPSQHTQSPPAHKELLCIGIDVFIGIIILLLVFVLCICIRWYLRSPNQRRGRAVLV